MKSSETIIVSRIRRLLISPMAQVRGTAITPLGSISFGETTPLFTTSQTLTPLFTSKYTLDTNGIFSVEYIRFVIVTNNSANATCLIQISGDGGITFADMTTEIGAVGFDLFTGGTGLWVSTMESGPDKLQVRILGRSTDGLSATILISDTTILDFTLNKKFVV